MHNLIGQDSQILCFIVIIISTDFFIVETGADYNPQAAWTSLPLPVSASQVL